MQKFFKVKAKGGHVGAGNDAELIFYIKAKDAIEAMNKVRRMPAVKHNKGSAISSVLTISEEEYKQGRDGYSAYDIYGNKETK